MNPTTQAVLLVLLGAVLGGGVVLAWRASEAMLRPRDASPVEPPAVVPPGVGSVLSVLPSSALVVEADDTVVKASAPAYAMGLVRDGALLVEEVAALVHAVRRDGQIREDELAIGTPARQVGVRVAPLDSRLVLVLAEDRTRERRVEAIRRDFVANVSHELKTPVGAIALLAEGVLDAADDPEAVRRFASMMQAEGERLATLVSKIIELSRLQDDETLDDAESVPVDGLLDQVVQENGVEADARRIRVLREGSRDLAVRGSREQLALALGNLVANAVTYSPDGSTVVVSAASRDDRVEISVVDQGIGIPAEEVDRIFERFYRLDPARQRSTGGTGLGLSIVKHVAASHGGDVRVWSAPGQGSTFTLSLPRSVTLPDRHAQEVLR
ncbi:MAG TPA: ATP-binding protein [Marmoricola sp.]|nr:ATP-binding protein [Marmoricola sp.]